MSYTNINFRTKKALKEALTGIGPMQKKVVIRCHNPGLGPDLSNYTGSVALEGPWYPAAHSWYCEGEMKDGVLVKVK